MAITTILTDIPTPPQSTDPANFITRADAFVEALDVFQPEMNTVIGEINSTETNINNKEASAVASATVALAAANFKGTWLIGTSYTVPSSVIYNGIIYLALQASTGVTPPNATYWAPINTAASIYYDNTTSGLTASDTQGAIDEVISTTIPAAIISAITGQVRQVKHFQTTALATGTATIPHDNTLPQITEGTQFLSLAFTPEHSGSLLYIFVHLETCLSISGYTIAALFDGGANAIAATESYGTTTSVPHGLNILRAYTTSSITPIPFTVRAGGNAASTITINGENGAGILGGALTSSIVIMEVY